jgi:transcriptional regulator with XRE-family HTH domain
MPKYKADYAALGEKIKVRREELKLSQETVAEKSDLSIGFYGNIERGYKKPSVDSLIQIANALDLNLHYLFLDLLPKEDNNNLQAQFEDIFSGKTPAQTDYLINFLKLISENLDKLKL